MATVAIFNEQATPQRVLDVLISVHTPDFSSRTDVVINPDLSLLEGVVPRKFWKHEAGAIVEWTQAEKDAKAAADAAAQAAAAAQRLIDIRAEAAAGLDNFEVTPLLLRAFADIIKDEINILRALHALPNRTLAQLKTAIANRVNDRTVDS